AYVSPARGGADHRSADSGSRCASGSGYRTVSLYSLGMPAEATGNHPHWFDELVSIVLFGSTAANAPFARDSSPVAAGASRNRRLASANRPADVSIAARS